MTDYTINHYEAVKYDCYLFMETNTFFEWKKKNWVAVQNV